MEIDAGVPFYQSQINAASTDAAIVAIIFPQTATSRRPK